MKQNQDGAFFVSQFKQGACLCSGVKHRKRLISRCELFDQNLKSALEIAEKAGNFGVGS